MTRHLPAATVLSWVLQKDAHALTCELTARADRSYDVIVVPHWDIAASAVEHFAALPEALLRHAEIARQLRESGWVVTSHLQAPLAA